MTVTQQKYSVKIQMILSLIPFVDIWAFYRIEKLRVLLGLVIVYGIEAVMSEIFYPDAMIVYILVTISAFIVQPLVMRHFTIKWNNLDTIRRKGSFSSDGNF